MAVLVAMGVGDISTLLIAFLMGVMFFIIGCRLFSFPKIFYLDGCSWVFLAKVIALLRKASKEGAGSLVCLMLLSSSNVVALTMIRMACSRWFRGWVPNTGLIVPPTMTSGYWAIARSQANRLNQILDQLSFRLTRNIKNPFSAEGVFF